MIIADAWEDPTGFRFYPSHVHPVSATVTDRRLWRDNLALMLSKCDGCIQRSMMGDMMWNILPDISFRETGGSARRDWRRLHIASYFQLDYASVYDYAAWKHGGGRGGGLQTGRWGDTESINCCSPMIQVDY